MKLRFDKNIRTDNTKTKDCPESLKPVFTDFRLHSKLSSGIKNTPASIKKRITDFIIRIAVWPKKHIPLPQPRTLLLLFILTVCGFASWAIKASAMHDRDLQKGIAQEIIRFHVIANSDSDADQSLKLTVKDTLVKNLTPLLQTAASIAEARSLLASELDYIEGLAEDTIRKNGYDYPVTVSLENCYFPLKVYGDYTFPPGYYEALRVKIGEAEGKNWWCVMFPPLCFVDETYSIVDESSGKKLKYLLTEEEYDTLSNKKTPVKIKFKLFEAIKNLFQ
jgi:stage II sporulation protein R